MSHNVGMPAGPLWRTIIEGGAHHSPPGNQTCWYMLNFSIKSKQFCEENKNGMRLKNVQSCGQQNMPDLSDSLRNWISGEMLMRGKM